MPQPPSSNKPPQNQSQKTFRLSKVLGISGLGAIVLGTLVAVFSPAPRACGCGSESKAALGTFTRAQQMYHLENGQFTNSLEDLDANVVPRRYRFETVPSDLSKAAIITATPIPSMPRSETRKSLTAYIFLTDAESNTSVQGMCQSLSPSMPPPPAPKFPESPSSKIICPTGSREIL